MKCISATKKGAQCKREAIHHRVPHCWQHTKDLLMESLKGLDADEELDNEEVYDVFIDALVDVSEKNRDRCEDDGSTEKMQGLEEEVAVLKFELSRIESFLEDCEAELQDCEDERLCTCCDGEAPPHNQD